MVLWAFVASRIKFVSILGLGGNWLRWMFFVVLPFCVLCGCALPSLQMCWLRVRVWSALHCILVWPAVTATTFGRSCRSFSVLFCVARLSFGPARVWGKIRNQNYRYIGLKLAVVFSCRLLVFSCWPLPLTWRLLAFASWQLAYSLHSLLMVLYSNWLKNVACQRFPSRCCCGILFLAWLYFCACVPMAVDIFQVISFDIRYAPHVRLAYVVRALGPGLCDFMMAQNAAHTCIWLPPPRWLSFNYISNNIKSLPHVCIYI